MTSYSTTRSKKKMERAEMALMKIKPSEKMSDDVARLKAENKALKQGIGFFRSVIQSGEAWTHTCQEKYDALLAEEAIGE